MEAAAVFEYRDMNELGRALDTFLEHARKGVLDTESHPPSPARIKVKGDNFNVLELSPGDSLFTAVIARSLGAHMASGFCPVRDNGYAGYVKLFGLLRQRGLALRLERDPQTLADLLQQCNGEYLTQGVRSLAHLPPNSVDFCLSNAVLEHVPKRGSCVGCR